MKTAPFFPALVGLSVLTLGLALAGEAPDQAPNSASAEGHAQTPRDHPRDKAANTQVPGKPEQTHERPSVAKANGQPGSTKVSPVRRPVPKPPSVTPAHRRPLSQGPIRSGQVQKLPANPLLRPQPGLGNSAGAAKEDPVKTKLVLPRQQPVPAFKPSTGLPLYPIPNRAPAAASIGGAPAPGGRSTGVINGTGMKHRP